MGNHEAASNVAGCTSEASELLDECQFAVHPKLIKVKVFEDESEAKEFAKQNEGSSAVGHGTKGYYVGMKTEPVEAISVGISEAVSKMQLNVELGFEWIPGVTWGQCH